MVSSNKPRGAYRSSEAFWFVTWTFGTGVFYPGKLLGQNLLFIYLNLAVMLSPLQW